MTEQFPQVVTIAGSDSDGSAGLQADLHTFFRRGVYGASILTAAVAGNSYGIHAAINMPTDFIDTEFKVLAEDYQIRAAKTGMLSDSELIHTVVKNLKLYDFGPLVVDPVIMTKHGNMLLEEEAYETLRKELIPLATVLTPNFFEAEKLAEMTITSDEEQRRAAYELKALGAKNVIVKGRHDSEEQKEVKDFVLLEDDTEIWLSESYIATDRVNGTGDTLSATIAAELARGIDVETAIRVAKKFVHRAISNEIEVGHKYGPINHWAGE
ncbi:MAG: bifunctional hydroxymethylpyrimidine kinase/phosphomethylpyrimidine kinase [Lactobacillales bacterium]|jgi:hydroxymethylpyrimidine/phosphomethylpyrimidine kinase|nr:bifunctional hydroxymethylpyrimidine kinase/phosphomethylpyrimidine kinase [Lactobacillales bacterium]